MDGSRSLKRAGRHDETTAVDWAAVDADIDGFLIQTAHAGETVRGYSKLWKLWSEHCTDLGCDPRRASWAAWQELAKRRRLDGRLYNRPYQLEEVLTAVRWRLGVEGLDLTPAPAQTVRRADWQALCRAYRVDVGFAAVSGDLEHVSRDPLLREHVQRIISLPPEALPYLTRRGADRDACLTKAEILLALDTGLTASALRRITFKDLRPGPDGLRIGDLLLPCDHRQRVEGVPHDCTACAVADVIPQQADPDQAFATTAIGTLNARFRSAARRWPHLMPPATMGTGGTALQMRPDLTPAQAAGTRRGLVLINAINPKDAAWLLGRAWLGVAWEAGFRMAGDLAHLKRRAVTHTSDPVGLLIRLAGTKDDPAGAKRVTRLFALTAGACAAQALAEYLTVRDAAVGDDPDGPLFISAPGGVFGPNWREGITKPVQVANAIITKLAAAAELDGHFTSYSARKGYAIQSQADGRNLLQIQRGLRHSRPDTTLRYAHTSSQAAARKLADLLGAKP